MKRLIRATSRNEISQLEDRIAEIKNNIRTAQIEGLDEDYIVDLHQELSELEDELNFAWQDDESAWNYAKEQQEFNPDGSLKLYAATSLRDGFIYDGPITDRQLRRIREVEEQEILDEMDYINIDEAIATLKDEFPDADIELLLWDGEKIMWSVNGNQCVIYTNGQTQGYVEHEMIKESDEYAD